MNLIEEIKKQSIDYELIKKNSVFKLPNVGDYDINFIITVRDRLHFAQPMFDSFKGAAKKVNSKICYTVVEHSERPDHSKFCKKNDINYIYIPAETGEQFNKCLSYNFGALFSVSAKYHLFHDIDILIQSSFFEKINTYIDKGSKALQCYAHRGVVNCELEITRSLLSKDISVDDLGPSVYGVNYPNTKGGFGAGSTGGSILVEDELFNKIGGYDPELFRAYSAEDQFFWNKLLTKVEIDYADDPEIDLFHMWHERQLGNNPFFHVMESYMTHFKSLTKEEKDNVVDYKSKIFSEIKRP